MNAQQKLQRQLAFQNRNLKTAVMKSNTAVNKANKAVKEANSRKEFLKLIHENNKNLLKNNIEALKKFDPSKTIAGHIAAGQGVKGTRSAKKVPCKSRGYGMGRRGNCRKK